MPGRLTLVGRDTELQQIAGALAEPDLGGVVLSGPGGVGKTRLGEECLRIGEDAGYETARVTATASAREIPLGAMTPLLGDIADNVPNLLVAARSALSHRAGGKRWILMVDDAHLLDGASAALVHGVASDRTAFLVATVRTGEVTPDAIVSLWKDEHARRFDIEPLTKVELAALAGELVGGRLDVAAERALCELAQGNPLALRELVTGAVRDGALREHDGAWRLVGRVPVSERLIEVIARRLETLDDDERAGLELVAVGEPLELAIATGLVGARVAETLEQERLIQVRDDRGVLEVWLGHPLHGEILREQLPVLRRRRILGDLAAAIATRPDLDRTALLRLARWRLELGETDDAELMGAAARWSRLAWDLNSAIAFARPVWEQHRDLEIGALLGHALCWTSQLEEAGPVLDDVLAQSADDAVLCFAALCRSETFFRNRDIESAFRIGEEYERRLPSPWCEELQVHQGWLLAMGGRVNDSLALIEPIADGKVERPAVLASLIAAVALPYAGRPVDGYSLIRGMRPRHAELWEREQLPTDPLGFEVSELTSMAMAGEFDDVETRGTRLYEGARSGGSGERVGGLAYALGRVAVDQGRLAEGLEWLRRSIDHYLDQGPELFAWVPLNTTVGAAAQLGDLASAHAAEQQLAGFRIPGIEFAAGDELVAVGWLRLMEGDTAGARSAWSRAVAHSVDHGRLMTTADALHALARAGLVDAIAIDPRAVRAKVQGALLTTRLEHVIGRMANDGAQLEAAGQAFADFGANLYAAEAFLDASRAYRHAGDQRAATQAARRGHELAALCPGAATPALRTTDEVVPLTNRERELALLAADGLSTKEIAERLFLSDRTVQNHLNRAYEKLGVSGRRELRKVLSRDAGDRED